MSTTMTSNMNEAGVSGTNTLRLPNIGLRGKAGAGKSTFAELLSEYFGYDTRSFAGPLKDVAAELWGDDARRDRSKLQPLGVSVREIEEDTWVNLLLRRLEENPPKVACAVDDLRFPNEYWGLKRVGFVIVEIRAHDDIRQRRLEANGKWQGPEQMNHISETALDEPRFVSDFIVYNEGGKTGLMEQMFHVLNQHRIRSEVW